MSHEIVFLVYSSGLLRLELWGLGELFVAVDLAGADDIFTSFENLREIAKRKWGVDIKQARCLIVKSIPNLMGDNHAN